MKDTRNLIPAIPHDANQASAKFVSAATQSCALDIDTNTLRRQDIRPPTSQTLITEDKYYKLGRTMHH